MNTVLPHRLTILAAAVALLSLPVLRAQTFDFNVDINTAGMSADAANAPFFLDFQLNYGDVALAPSSVVLSNFSFTGGTALGSTVIPAGTAAGDLTSSVTLTASSGSPLNELYQQFSSAVTDIRFKVAINQPGSVTGTPTQFSVAILDNSVTFPYAIFTTAPDTANLLTLNLQSPNTLSDVNTYTSLYSADGVTVIDGVTAAVPEASTTAALCGAAAVLFAFGVRRFRLVR